MALFKVLTEKPERKIFKMQKKLLQNPDIISVLGLGQVKKQNLLIFSTAYTCRIAGSLITHEKVFQKMKIFAILGLICEPRAFSD